VVAFSMLISATNALTLSPALCEILLKPTHQRRGIMGAVMGGIDRVRDGYAYLVARLVRVVLLVLVLVAVAVAGAGFATGWLFQVTPTGSLPEEDQGAFMAEVQLPQGASVNRTLDVVKQVEEIVGADPAIEHVLTVPGYSILDGQCSVQQRLRPRPAQALRGAFLAGFEGRCGDRPGRGQDRRHAERPRYPVQPAADYRAWDQWWLRVPT